MSDSSAWEPRALALALALPISLGALGYYYLFWQKRPAGDSDAIAPPPLSQAEAAPLFDDAANHVQNVLVSKLSATQKLALYGAYKQAVDGPCDGPQPSVFDAVGRQKRAAWDALRGLSSQAARARYVTLVASADPTWAAARQTGGPPPVIRNGGIGGPVFSTMAAASLPSHPPPHSAPHGPTSLALEAFHTYANEGAVTDVEACLNTGMSVDAVDEEGRTALHWAVDGNQAKAVALLLARGAGVNIRDRDGMTPLHYAALCEHRGLAESLVAAGASVSILDRDGCDPRDLGPPAWAW